MVSSRRCFDRNENLTVSTLLTSRARRFIGSTALVMLGSLALITSYILSVEFSRSKTSTQAWIDANRGRIEQALFLENALAIQGLLGEANTLKIDGHQQITSISIKDVHGREVASFGKFQGTLASSESPEASYRLLLGRLVLVVPLEFADRPQGQMVVEASIDRSTLLHSALVTLALTSIVLIAIGLAARSLIKELKERVLNPLSSITDSITAPNAAARSLDGDAIQESMFAASAVEIQLLFESHKKLISEIRELAIKEKEHAALTNKVAIASQVSHDIRSPLSALKMVLGATNSLREEERLLIQASIDRINSIADKLLSRPRLESAETASGAFILGSAINSLVTEKRIEFADHSITISIDELSVGDNLVRGDAEQFKTVLSNLINNAAEACQQGGVIRIRAKALETTALIEIEDNGSGIPSEVLAKLGHVPVSHGKTAGNGIGVFSARQTIESFGGKISIKSSNTAGTIVSIGLRMKLDELMLNEIQIGHRRHVVVVDDDNDVARAWRLTLPANVAITSLCRPEELTRLVSERAYSEDTLFLIDYEFKNSSDTGMDLITRLELQEQAVLVTGRAYDQDVRTLANRNRIRLMAKDDIRHSLAN